MRRKTNDETEQINTRKSTTITDRFTRNSNNKEQSTRGSELAAGWDLYSLSDTEVEELEDIIVNEFGYD